MNDHVLALAKKIDALCSKNTNLQEQVNGTYESLGSVEQSRVSLPSQLSTSSHMVNAMNNYFDRERRKQNLVIYGLPESEGSDTRLLIEICQMLMHLVN